MTIQNGSEDLFSYLLAQYKTGEKNWFDFPQQRVVGVWLAIELAKHHAPEMNPEECAEYAFKLNNAIFDKIINPRLRR